MRPAKKARAGQKPWYRPCSKVAGLRSHVPREAKYVCIGVDVVLRRMEQTKHVGETLRCDELCTLDFLVIR